MKIRLTFLCCLLPENYLLKEKMKYPLIFLRKTSLEGETYYHGAALAQYLKKARGRARTLQNSLRRAREPVSGVSSTSSDIQIDRFALARERTLVFRDINYQCSLLRFQVYCKIVHYSNNHNNLSCKLRT